MKGGKNINTFDVLIDKFRLINSQGYIKSVNNNKNSSGLTLEHLLGRSGGDFNIPDYDDTEIKAIKRYYLADISLFNSTPDGKYITATQWLSENYGYPDKDYKNIKVFKGNIYANKKNKVGIMHKYKLHVDRNAQKVYLNIYDIYGKFLNNFLYWDFDSLKEKLERKLTKLAVFEFNKKIINNDIYYKFVLLKLYELRDFDKFIECVENGTIFITINTGVNKSGPYAGKFVDHGTSFRICKNNLHKLYHFITCVWDQKKDTNVS